MRRFSFLVLLFLIMGVALASFAMVPAYAADKEAPLPSASPEKVAPVGTNPSPTERMQLQRTAAEAQARIQASDSEKKAITAAIQSKNTEEAKSVLLKAGFTPKQLEGATIVMKDETGGKGTAERIKVRIEVTVLPACNCYNDSILTVEWL